MSVGGNQVMEQMAGLSKTESGSGLFGSSQQAAGVTAAWIHASARRWGETWIRKYQRSLFFARCRGRQKPLGDGGLRACALKPKGVEFGCLASLLLHLLKQKNNSSNIGLDGVQRDQIKMLKADAIIMFVKALNTSPNSQRHDTIQIILRSAHIYLHAWSRAYLYKIR